jgi:HAMP domain-containing protein
VRTLSWISRAFAVAAAVVAASIIVGGSYFVGFVSEVQRGLNDPDSASHQAAEGMSTIEQMLGYNGYLKSYRTFRLTGDASARVQMTQRAMESARTLDVLRKIYGTTPTAARSLADIGGVIEEFARVARSAPDMGPGALRGSPNMEVLEAMPQVPQLETTYLTLRTALERLRSQTQSHQLGSIAWALSWSQMLVVGALALLVFGLIAAAGVLQLGITQPLKSLEQSLASVGDGQVNQPVWGTDRPDEIGTLARAGEKLRRSLTETDTLKALAEKGEVHVRLEGDASILFEKLASGVTSAAEALKNATAEIAENQALQRQQFQTSIERLDMVVPKFEQVAGAIGRTADHVFADAAQRVETSMAASLDRIIETADKRTQSLNQITGQFEQSGKHLSEAVDLVRGKTGNAIDGITASITAFKKAADGAQSIQGAFFEACDRISSDASATADNIKGLAQRLNGIVDSVDGQLAGKLESLGRLEGGIESTLGTIEQRTRETTDAIAAAAAAMEQRTSQTEQRTEKSIDEFESIVSLFRDEHVEALKSLDHESFSKAIERLNEVSSSLQARMEQAPQGKQQDPEALMRALARRIDISLGSLNAQANQQANVLSQTAATIEQRAAESEKHVVRSMEEFQDLLDLFRNGQLPAVAAPAPQATSTLSNIDEIVAPLTKQIETLRNDVRELAMRMTEERILMTAEMRAKALPPEARLTFTHPQRSLADVPMNEIMERLKDLQDEMNAPAPQAEAHGSLTTVLNAFSESLRGVARTRNPLGELKGLVPKLTRFADDIELGAKEVKPTAAALRAELGAITSELRTMTRNVQTADATGADILLETALYLGARAESLFSYLNQTQPEDFRAARSTHETATFEQTADDLDTLARIIDKLEQRTSSLSDEAVAANLDHQTAAPSPSENGLGLPADRGRGDTAIATVFEAIERLNSIAAALARASDANQQHRAAI